LPRQVAVFDDFYLVVTGREINGIVGGGGETIIDVNRGGFGSGGGGKEAGSFDKGTLVEANFVATGQEGNKVGGDNNKRGGS